MAHDSDFLVIGGGIAGAAAAFNLAAHGRVQILEMEDAPGYHTTGRSAALYTETYGNRVVRAITSASRDFLSHPPAGFVDGPVLTQRGTLLAATAETEAVLDQAERDADALGAVTERLHGNALFDRAPYLARTVVTGGLFEPAAMDMDVDLLHRGFLRGAARQGGQLTCRAPVHADSRRRQMDRRHTGRRFPRPGGGQRRRRLGRSYRRTGRGRGHRPDPKRRSAFTFEAPANWLEAMPATIAVDESWYVDPRPAAFWPARPTRRRRRPATPSPRNLTSPSPPTGFSGTPISRSSACQPLGRPAQFVADKTFVVGFAPGHDGFLVRRSGRLWYPDLGGDGRDHRRPGHRRGPAGGVTDRGAAADLSPGRSALAGWSGCSHVVAGAITDCRYRPSGYARRRNG